jgi:hypothetical protein
VPIYKQDALDLLLGLSTWLQSQSTLAYLKDPPSGYLMASVDILGGLDDIRDKVVNDQYSGEFEFQAAIQRLISLAHDGHFVFLTDMYTTFIYEREIGGLVVVSMDGVSMPEVYSYSEPREPRLDDRD